MIKVKVLDHGYVGFVEKYGSDESIVEAARMSTGRGFLRWDPGPCPMCDGTGSVFDDSKPIGVNFVKCIYCNGTGNVVGDLKLLSYLYTHHHNSPFEMAGMIIEVQAPIFVFREWHRHRTQSYNEMSARYVPLPDVNYIPTVERLLISSKENKQAGTIKGADELTEVGANYYIDRLKSHYEYCEELYQDALKSGVPKELARIHLPVGRYSRMRAAANLRNWLAFLTLRLPPDAQWEIRQYANEVAKLIEINFPRTYELFAKGQ